MCDAAARPGARRARSRSVRCRAACATTVTRRDGSPRTPWRRCSPAYWSHGTASPPRVRRSPTTTGCVREFARRGAAGARAVEPRARTIGCSRVCDRRHARRVSGALPVYADAGVTELGIWLVGDRSGRGRRAAGRGDSPRGVDPLRYAAGRAPPDSARCAGRDRDSFPCASPLQQDFAVHHGVVDALRELAHRQPLLGSRARRPPASAHGVGIKTTRSATIPAAAVRGRRSRGRGRIEGERRTACSSDMIFFSLTQYPGAGWGCSRSSELHVGAAVREPTTA